MPRALLVDLSVEVLEHLVALVDVKTLVVLSTTCHLGRERLDPLIEARSKHACFTVYLYPTVAALCIQAAVPATWRQLYVAYQLKQLNWKAYRAEGTSSLLRALKFDNQEYEADPTVTFLIRSGGHYWFNVLQARISDVMLAKEGEHAAVEAGTQSTEKHGEMPFLRAPQHIRLRHKWEKIRAVGNEPCPRRHHTMTCLPNALCSRKLVTMMDGEELDAVVNVRRIVIFGGHSEGLPIEAFNDLHLLCIEAVEAKRARKACSAWVKPRVTGQAPSPRCGHGATLLMPDLIMITGGSVGVSPILTMEVYFLHVEGCADFRWSTPSCTSSIPRGRSSHDVYRLSQSQVIIHGGHQIRQSNGLLDVHKLHVTTTVDALGDTQCSIEWSKPRLSGSLPRSRRGHSTDIIGPNLLVFGGQIESTGQLMNDVHVLDVARLRWKRLDVPGEAPCPRRGFKNQFFGTAVVISSGFVRSTPQGKVEHQLPESSIHGLSLLK